MDSLTRNALEIVLSADTNDTLTREIAKTIYLTDLILRNYINFDIPELVNLIPFVKNGTKFLKLHKLIIYKINKLPNDFYFICNNEHINVNTINVEFNLYSHLDNSLHLVQGIIY
jgi:hypothetical protein